MSNETPSTGPVLTRRGLLFPVTAGVGAAALGLGLWGLARSMGSGDVSRAVVSVDLRGIAEGKEVNIRVRNQAVLIRHRTSIEIAAAEADDQAKMSDPLARNLNLDPAALSTDANRRATPDGRFIAVDGHCTRTGCVVSLGGSDFGGWICACCAANYDTAGRIRKGPAPRNLGIPFLRIRDEMTLDLYAADAPPMPDLDRLLYGAKG